MSNEPKSEREKLIEVYHQLTHHLDHAVISPSVREQLAAERVKVIGKIKALDEPKQP